MTRAGGKTDYWWAFLAMLGEMRFVLRLCQCESPASWSNLHMLPGGSVKLSVESGIWGSGFGQVMESEILGQRKMGHMWILSNNGVERTCLWFRMAYLQSLWNPIGAIPAAGDSSWTHWFFYLYTWVEWQWKQLFMLSGQSLCEAFLKLAWFPFLMALGQIEASM